MCEDYRKRATEEIRVFQCKLGLKTRRKLKEHLRISHGIEISEGALSKMFKGGRGGLSLDRILAIKEALKNECIARDKKANRLAKTAGSAVLFADGNRSLKDALALMCRKRYSQMPVKDGDRVVGIIVDDLVDKMLKERGGDDTLPAKEFCVEPNIVPWDATLTEAMMKVRGLDDKYVLVSQRGDMIRIITRSDYLQWSEVPFEEVAETA